MTDLIDRQTLIKRLKVWDTPDVTDKMLYNFALNRALEMPTIEAEPKHGRWEVVYYDNIPTLAYCNRCSQVLRFTRETETTPNYCPNCGAKMDQEDE